jgi:DNA-binding transcriptional MerR regulator
MLTIGEFSRRTRLSAKALRLYEQLGLLMPADIDRSSGYRHYSETQVARAKEIALLRRVDMPLAVIAEIIDLAPADATAAIAAYWSGVETLTAERRALVHYLLTRHEGDDHTMYDIKLRHVGERGLFTISRHVHADAAGEFFGAALQRLRSAAPGLPGVDGVPFLVYYGEVSDDSDGPMELCRPVGFAAGETVIASMPEVQLRREPAHDEAFIRLTRAEVAWPSMLPAIDALERWLSEQGRQPLGPPRQLMIADWRTAPPDAPACDLAVPLR